MRGEYAVVAGQVRAKYIVSASELPMDGPAFRCWAKLMHRNSDTLYEEAMIAAIARVNGLAVVTRNVTDFGSFGVEVLNPFEFSAKG